MPFLRPILGWKTYLPGTNGRRIRKPMGVVRSPGTPCSAAIFHPLYDEVRAMNRLRQWVGNFLRREDGPTAVEYAVMLALIIVVCIAAITTLGTNANSTFSTAGNAVGGTSGS